LAPRIDVIAVAHEDLFDDSRGGDAELHCCGGRDGAGRGLGEGEGGQEDERQSSACCNKLMHGRS
jgi:hypothetical protein